MLDTRLPIPAGMGSIVLMRFLVLIVDPCLGMGIVVETGTTLSKGLFYVFLPVDVPVRVELVQLT